MPSYTENVRAGQSRITCDWCGEVVTAELRHEREHGEGKWGGDPDGVEAREGE